jgi:succinate dehydrogenase / fumarate reductase cytochrome b subunit
MADSKPSARSPDRPLSPHLQIYRWPVTMLTSITHRLTGVAISAGLILVALFLAATAFSPDTFTLARELLASLFGRLILFLFTLALSFHLLNGIRHLAWDAGWGFGLTTARNTGLLVIAGTLVLTLVIWVAAYWLAGALS